MVSNIRLFYISEILNILQKLQTPKTNKIWSSALKTTLSENPVSETPCIECKNTYSKDVSLECQLVGLK